MQLRSAAMQGRQSEQDLRARLAAIPFFASLETSIIEELARAAERREYAAGDVLFVEGEPSPGLFILESGYVKAVKSSAEGREHVLEFIGPSQPFNTVAVFTPRPSPATAVALEPASVWMVPRETVARLVRENPAFAEQIIERMAERLVFVVGLVSDLSLRSVTARLASLLLQQAEGDVVHRPRWFTVPELAGRLGTVPDVAQRSLGRLATDGIVEVTRREIRIRDRARLREIAGADVE